MRVRELLGEVLRFRRHVLREPCQAVELQDSEGASVHIIPRGLEFVTLFQVARCGRQPFSCSQGLLCLVFATESSLEVPLTREDNFWTGQAPCKPGDRYRSRL